MIEERTGEAFELGKQLTVVGRKLEPGGVAPGFELDYFDPVEEEMKTFGSPIRRAAYVC